MSIRSNVITALCTAGLCIGVGAGMSGPDAPTVVASSTEQMLSESGAPTNGWRVWRTWSDGSIDVSRVSFDGATGCEVIGVCTRCVAGDCPSDVNGDGAIDAEDLANVLGAWGDCPECPSGQ